MTRAMVLPPPLKLELGSGCGNPCPSREREQISRGQGSQVRNWMWALERAFGKG